MRIAVLAAAAAFAAVVLVTRRGEEEQDRARGMPPNFGERMSDAELESLIDYLLTVR